MNTTFLQIRRLACGLTVALILSACGARSTSEYGLEEATAIMVVGEQLEGLQIEIGDWYHQILTAEDISRSVGALTVRRNTNEKMERVVIETQPGQQTVTVFSNGYLILSRDLYLSVGQTMEVRILDTAR